MRSVLLAATAIGLLVSAAPAQNPGEDAFLKDAAKKLNGFATRCAKGNYPMRAREVWFEVVNEYDTNDEVARENLGFLRVGSTWAPDSRFSAPTKDEPNASVARILAKNWDSVCKALGSGHRDLAAKLEGSDPARSEYHYQRALRFLPKDKRAVRGSGLASYEGIVGTPAELTILKRSRQMDREIARQLDATYKVERLAASVTHPVLETGGVQYSGVESRRFRIWGDWEPEILEQAAQNAERAVAFCEVILEGFKGYSWRHKKPVDLAFFKERDTWVEVVRNNGSKFRSDRLEFVLQHTSATAVGAGPGSIRLAGVEDVPTVNDLAVRWPVQDFAGFGADAMDEGVGHAIVGMFFGRNLVFTVGQETEKKGGTSSGAQRRKAKLQLPDIEVWNELAIEFAHERTDIPAARLPLLKAASFPDEGRIKAWAFCDYLLRRDPNLMRTLDRSGGNASRPNETDVAALFAERAGMPLADLDAQWRRFWTEDTELTRAVKGKKTPLESVSKLAPQMLEEFNRLRVFFKRRAVSWSADYSAPCKQHAEYLKANKGERGPIKEQMQDPKKRGYTNAGRMFAPRALVHTKAKKPRDTMEQWIHWPGFRDAILNPQLDVVGLYVESGILVMDVARGQGVDQLFSVSYPNNGQSDVPASIAVKELGPEVARRLKKLGHGKAKEIGYPVSAHFFRTKALPKRATIQCTLLANGKDAVRGFVHVADGGQVRRTSANGLVVFYAFEPLRRGTRYTMEWTYTKKDGSAGHLSASDFTTL